MAEPLRSAPPLLAIMTVLATACGDRVYAGYTSGASDESSSTSGASPQSTTAIDEPAPQPPSESSDEGNPNFIIEPDGGGAMLECDTFAQDCPAGEKCAAWANDGGNAWNATKCVPIAADPDDVGDPCTVVGSGVSGEDSCVHGAMCWDVDPETNVGTCVALCIGDESDPMCEDPTTRCVGRSPLTLCLPTCCPVEQNCSEGQACYPVINVFMCLPDASGPDLGEFGDPCEYINACDPGFFCADADSVPGCQGGSGCCSALCEVGSQTCDAFDPAMDCTPWFAEGEAPPGFEHTGACLVPE